jgi:hypothetical protein
MVDEHGLVGLVELRKHYGFAIGREGRENADFFQGYQREFASNELVVKKIAVPFPLREIDSSGRQRPVAPTSESRSFHHQGFLASASRNFPNFIGNDRFCVVHKAVGGFDGSDAPLLCQLYGSASVSI